LPRHQQQDSNDSLVRTEIQRNAGPAILVAYRMHKTAGDWKVYDISIDGISLLANYHRNFSREVRRSGAEGLMKKLSSRNTHVASNH
jgi:phospholipid transport system substrate-binding protein